MHTQQDAARIEGQPTWPGKRRPLLLAVSLVLTVLSVGPWVENGAWAQGACTGDCNHDSTVTVDEIVMGVNIALGIPILCPAFDLGADGEVTIDELIAAVNNALTGCGAQTNRAPWATDVSFSSDTSTPYVEKQLIGADPDNDVITYELIGDDEGTGYSFAYVNPESGVLYLVLEPDFQGRIALPYRVTDGRLFSNTAAATVQVQAATPSWNAGVQEVDPKEYAGYPRGFYNGALLGAPGGDPTLPLSVDLS